MELLVRVKDKDQKDQELARLASKAGDVIACCPDGWGWTKAERENPDWRIVKVDLLPIEKNALLSVKMDGEKMVAKRGQRVDLAKLVTIATSVETIRDPKEVLEIKRTDFVAAVAVVSVSR